MFDDNKGPMMTELNVQYTDIQNKRRAGLVWMVGIGVIILFQIPGGIIGFIMGVSGKAQRACGTVISLIGFMITSVMLMNSDDGFFMSILLYVKSFYVYFIKHEYLYIALNYFPRSIASACVFFMALESGLIFGYYLFSQGHNDITRKESRVRYNRQGQQEKFMDKDQIKRELNKRLRREKKEKEKRPETIIGSTSLGDEIAITDDEARMHTLVCGASGSGKTTTLEHFILSCARRGLPCIFVDGKYDEEFPFKVKAIAEKYSRKFYHFDINGEMSKTKWNPLKNGTNSNLKDKLIDLTDWSEPHYKVNAERALMLILDVVTKIEEETKEMNEDEKKAYFTFEKKEDEKEDKKGKNKKKAKQNTPPEAEQQKKIIDTRINVFEDSKNDSNKSQKEKKTLEGFVVEKSLISIYQLLVPSRLSDAISCVKSEEAKKDFVDRQRRLNADWYAGLESRVALLAETAILKELLSEDKSGIDLRRVLEDEEAIVFFSLDRLQNKSLTEMVGRMIVKDISTVIALKGLREGKTPLKAYAIYDEHGAYVSEDVEDQFGMARSKGLCVITAVQEISDFQKSSLGDILVRKVLGNTNVKLIMLQNDADNAEYLARVVGTEKRRTSNISSDCFGEFKGLSIKNENEFRVHPDDIKSLGIGQAVVLVKTPAKKLERKVFINRLKF